jgi:hypothetical protein
MRALHLFKRLQFILYLSKIGFCVKCSFSCNMCCVLDYNFLVLCAVCWIVVFQHTAVCDVPDWRHQIELELCTDREEFKIPPYSSSRSLFLASFQTLVFSSVSVTLRTWSGLLLSLLRGYPDPELLKSTSRVRRKSTISSHRVFLRISFMA